MKAPAYNNIAKMDDQQRWQSTIVQDLHHIKKHLRYPWKKGMKSPIVIGIFVIGLLVLNIVYGLTIFLQSHRKPVGTLPLFPVVILVLVIAGIFRYLHSLRFTSIETPFDDNTNLYLLKRFFDEKGLLVFQHPTHEEVLQLLSRPLQSGEAMREALILIADRKRILINSHFVDGSIFQTFKNHKAHDREMARELRAWLAKQTKVGTDLM